MSLLEIQQASYRRGRTVRSAAAWPPEQAMGADELDAFLAERALLRPCDRRPPKGRPQARPVAFTVLGDSLWFATVAGGRLKNLERTPWVSVVVAEGEGDEHRAVAADGPVTLFDEPPEGLLELWEARFGSRAEWAVAWFELRPGASLLLPSARGRHAPPRRARGSSRSSASRSRSSRRTRAHRRERVAERLDGRRLESVEAVGKNLVLRFEGGVVLRSHLRMSGRWSVRPRGARSRGTPVARPARRRSSRRVLWNGPVLELHTRALARLGPDILALAARTSTRCSRGCAAPTAPARSARRSWTRRLVAGIGNMWMAETLWRERALAVAAGSRDVAEPDRRARPRDRGDA